MQDDAEQKKQHAIDLYRQSVENIDQDDVEEAAAEGEQKVARLENAIPASLRRLWNDLKTLIALLRDYLAGRYTDLPFRTIAAVAAAVLYFASPIDAIPDMIPGLGYVDDDAVLTLCLQMISRDLENYRHWRTAEKN